MNQDKKIDIIKRKNERLQKQLDECSLMLEIEKQENRMDEAKVVAFMNEFSILQKEYEDAVTDLRKCQAEYQEVINELQEMKYDLIESGIRPPFYIRFYYKLKRLIQYWR